MSGPVQFSPPFSGGGSSHALDWFLSPPPHVTVQDDESVQSLQLPLTAMEEK